MSVNSWFSNVGISSVLRCSLPCLALVFAGCGRNDIQVYRVAKDQPQQQQQQAQPGMMPPGHPDVSGSGSSPGLQWKTPAGWEEAPAGQMRLASFRVPGKDGKVGDVSVVPLPGMAGSDLSNVNRWRDQVGLQPVSEQELPKLAEQVQIGDQNGQLYDQTGVNAGSGEKWRILAALVRRDGIAWFFKMTGDPDLLGEQKPAFKEFLKSLVFAATVQTTQTDLPPSHPPIGGSEMMASAAGASAASAAPAQDKPSWQVPAGWQEVPGGQFLVAKFMISGSGGAQAAVNVSSSVGDGGGLLANINRWRGQLGLTPVAESDLAQQAQPLAISGSDARLVEMAGTDARTGQKAHLVGVIVPKGSQTWFYKLMGNEQLVAQQKDAFTTFVQGVKY